MHEENKRSLRHSYRASRVPKSQLNIALEHVAKLPRICDGGINVASSGSSGDKEDNYYDFFQDGYDIGNDIGGFGGTNNVDESNVQDGCNNEFKVVHNHEDLVDDEVQELVEAAVPDFNFAEILSSLIKKEKD